MSTPPSPTESSLRGRQGFCIYVDTLCQGPTVAVRDGDGWPCVFDTEIDAQREIVDSLMLRLDQFREGTRDFDDAISVDEFIVPVWVRPDGSVVDEAERHFGRE